MVVNVSNMVGSRLSSLACQAADPTLRRPLARVSYPQVVRVYCTYQDPDYENPWQHLAPRGSTGSGVVIGSRRMKPVRYLAGELLRELALGALHGHGALADGHGHPVGDGDGVRLPAENQVAAVPSPSVKFTRTLIWSATSSCARS